MRRMARTLLVLSTLFLVACGEGAGAPGDVASGPGAADAAASQPYAGLEDRPIRALAPERVADLLAGRGAGYALAAELNHYPGPTHVLALGAQLELTKDQEQAVQGTLAAMRQEAQQLGQELVDLEAELDRAFRSGSIAPEQLAQLTERIAAVEGQLRRTHLAAHLEMKAVLSPQQVALYDELRGYTGGAATDGQNHQHGRDNGGQMHHQGGQ